MLGLKQINQMLIQGREQYIVKNKLLSTRGVQGSMQDQQNRAQRFRISELSENNCRPTILSLKKIRQIWKNFVFINV